MPSRTPGVAEGKEVAAIPIGEGISLSERVFALMGVTEENQTSYNGWGASILRDDMKLISATVSPTSSVTFSYVPKAEHCNRLGNLHGGCTATIFDVATTCALAPIAKKGFWQYAGVSRTLNVTYIRPIPVGEKVLVEAEVIHAGKRLCSLKGTMKRESDGAILAICEHGKVSIDPVVESKL